MCVPFRKTKYGGPTVRIFSDPGQIFHVTSNAWFLLTLPRFGVKKDKYIFLALSSVVRILELADLDDVFAEQNGSAQHSRRPEHSSSVRSRCLQLMRIGGLQIGSGASGS